MTLTEMNAKAAEYEAAFARVRPVPNWKAPINAVVAIAAPAELEAILEAVEFFTATQAVAVPFGTGQAVVYRITAPGYWAGPAN